LEYRQAQPGRRKWINRLQIRQRLFGESSEEVAASYNDMDWYTVPPMSISPRLLREGVRRISENTRQGARKIAIASNNIGTMYRQLQLYGDAVNNFETALAIWKKVYPNGHPNQASALVNLGRTYSQMGDKKSGIGLF